MSDINASLFCPAWMIPCAAEEADKPPLVYKVQTVKTDIKDDFGEFLQVRLSTLVPSEHHLCHVRTIDDKYFAVLKRGLL